jgi:dolichol-phosphate mannosyltransferase
MREQTPVEVSIVIPTFNESGNVSRLLDLLEQALRGISYEAIFVDDDSPDGTAEAVRAIAQRDPRVRVLRRIGRSGLASACVEGMMTASAPYVAVMDADLQHDERILPEMLRRAREDRLDIVVGSRNVAGGGMGDFAAERVALSGWGRKISQLVCRSEVSDPMSGFFLADRRFLEEVIYDVSAIGFKILVDLLASAKRPVRLGEVPYTFRNREEGESKLDVLVMVEYAQLIFDKMTGSAVPSRFLLFAAVGGAGVGVHLAVLAVLYRGLEWRFTWAYAAAALAAMTCNFFLNNIVTYRDCRLKGWVEKTRGWMTFCLACAFGGWLAIFVANQMRLSGLHWLAASLAGILVASVWNYAMTQMLTWRLQLKSRQRRRLRREKRWTEVARTEG